MFLDDFRLKGEKDLCALINKLMDYVNARLDKDIFLEEEVCKLYMLRIEHLYYKVNFSCFFIISIGFFLFLLSPVKHYDCIF